VTLRPGYGIRLDSAARLLSQHTPAATIEADWPHGRIRVSAYLGAIDLPSEIPGRVRCFVTDGDRILVTWDADDNPDCFPGGGAEPGETIAETASREVWEETGWRIDVDSIEVIGWIHLESLFDWSDDFPFTHPDSFMTVVRATASHSEGGDEPWVDIDGFIARSAFVTRAELPRRVIDDAISGAFLRSIFDDL
jgi:8-oxo-dGTP pyrophosphatase MutT (NUDIX family)